MKKALVLFLVFCSVSLRAEVRSLTDSELSQVHAGYSPEEFLSFVGDTLAKRAANGENLADADVAELIERFNRLFLLYADEVKIEGAEYGNFFISLFVDGKLIRTFEAPSSYEMIRISNLRPGGPGSESMGSFVFEGVTIRGEIRVTLRE